LGLDPASNMWTHIVGPISGPWAQIRRPWAHNTVLVKTFPQTRRLSITAYFIPSNG
jgi:hypothetical protein